MHVYKAIRTWRSSWLSAEAEKASSKPPGVAGLQGRLEKQVRLRSGERRGNGIESHISGSPGGPR